MATDREILNKAIAGLVGGSSEPAADMLVGGQPANTTTGAGHDLHRRSFRLIKLANDPAAGDNTANGVCNGTYWIQAQVPRKARLVGAKALPMVAVTSNNTDYATINVTKDNGGGGSQTVILSNTTKNTAGGGLGSFAAGSYINLTPSVVTTSDAHVIDAGSYLQVQVTKAGSGVALKIMSIELDLEEI